MPREARRDIHERFTRDKRGDHLGAFWELYLHELAVQLPVDILEVNIGQDDTDDRRPDLLLGQGENRVFVEATAVLGDDVVSGTERMLIDELYDTINKQVQSLTFSIAVTIESCGATSPPKARIIKKLRTWLTTLDADVDQARVDHGGQESVLPVSLSGWEFEFVAFPIAREHRGDSGRIIGSSFEGSSLIDDVTPLRHKIRKKAGHYGALEHPYVIALLCGGTFVDDHDIGRALLGSGAYHWDPAADEVRGYRARNGAWMSGGPAYTRNSAILTAVNLTPRGCVAVEPTVWTNPWAERPLNVSFPFRRMEGTQPGRIIEHPATGTVTDVLGLSARWPEVP